MNISGQPHPPASLFLVKELAVPTGYEVGCGLRVGLDSAQRPLLGIKPLLLQSLYSLALCRLKSHFRSYGVLDGDNSGCAV
jgi:hypothetical protein